MSLFHDLKLDKKSSKLAVAANTLFGLVLESILHSAKGGNCLATLIGLVLVASPMTAGVITLVPKKIGVFLISLDKGCDK